MCVLSLNLEFFVFSPSVDDHNEDERKLEEEEVEEVKDVDGEKQLVYVFFFKFIRTKMNSVSKKKNHRCCFCCC